MFGSLAAGGAVEDSFPGELVESVDLELSPRDAAREDDRPRVEDVAAVEVDPVRCGIDAGDLSRDDDLGAEPSRLQQRATRQRVAGDARRKAEIILDSRRRPGLAAGCLALDRDRPEALRRPVHGGCEACRPGADDHGVVLRQCRLGRNLEQLRDAPQLRPEDDLVAVDDPNRRLVVFVRDVTSPMCGFGGHVRLQPAERNLVPVEEAPELRAGRIAAASEHDGAERGRCRGPRLEPFRPREPVVRKRGEAFPDDGKPRDELLVVMKIEPEHAGWLGGTEAGRVKHPEHDRHFAEHAPGEPFADDADDAVRGAQHLDASREDAEERAIVSFVDGELPWCEGDVRHDLREAHEHVSLEVGEQLDAGDLLRSDHLCILCLRRRRGQEIRGTMPPR